MPTLVFVAFLLPVGVYLLFLGWLNRQPRPILISGTWDFIGVLFAASGFLLVGGPAILSSLNDRWRMLWILGEFGQVTEGLDSMRQIGFVLAAIYFIVVIGCSALVLMGRRGTTAIYNIDAGVVEELLERINERLELGAVRTGNVFVFGLAEDKDKTVLEIESFAPLRHVTLRWDAADAPLRKIIESELDRRLATLGTSYHETGAWLTMLGTTLLGMAALLLLAVAWRVWHLR